MVQVWGPLGSHFPLPAGDRVVLVGGGVGVPPMVYWAEYLAALTVPMEVVALVGAAKKEFLYVGYNSRLDAMQAAFLRIFLRHIDDWNAQRRNAAARYGELLDGLVETPQDDAGHVYHMYCVRSPERDRLATALKDADIGSAVYYQPPLHLQPALRYLGYAEGDLPETEKASRENLCLPLWAGIEEEQQARVASVLEAALQVVRS